MSTYRISNPGGLKFAAFFILLTFGACQNTSKGSEKTEVQETVDENEVTWETDINAALEKARKSGKLLFVECYSPTCPVCQSMEPFFKKPEVAKLYNSSFVNFKLDVGNAELVKFLNQKNIFLPSFPQFLFFDGNGTLVHQAEVTADIASFAQAANTAKAPEQRASSFKGRFDKGERSLDFLVAYASFAYIAKDTAANLATASELFSIFPDNELGTELSWKITKKCVTDIDNGFAKYWFNHVPQAAAFEKKAGHEGTESNVLGRIIQSSLYSPRGKQYNTAKLNLIREYMGKVGAGQYAEGVTWEFDVNALIREGKAPAALAICNKMAGKYGNNGQSLVYITKVLNDAYPDNSYVQAARGWLLKAKPLIKENNALAEYYFESARLSLKSGDKVTAKTDATQAFNLASGAGVNTAKFSALLAGL